MRARVLTCVLGSVVAIAALGFAWWAHALGPAPRGDDLAFSTVVLDREGRLLRPYATPEGRWRLPVSLADVDPRTVALLLAYEDRRFRSHPGVDPLALGRAAWQWATSGRIVSGGSTITMQVARLLEPRQERSLGAKLRQMVRAVELERRLHKDEILTLYLNLAPYGGNLEGIRAASLSYFGKEPRRLSLSESALLVALPQSPEARRPDRSAKTARAARDRVLARSDVPADEIAQARMADVPHARRPMPALAPHAADQAVAARPSERAHRLTLDAALQRALQDLAQDRARALGPDLSVAIVAVDHESGEIRARVASADYFDQRRAGQVDQTQALRSPGSALKPFIYGLAFEDGAVHPETLIDDRPMRYGAYAPENFDMTHQGSVSIRRALQLSLNVPAVTLLDKVGPSRLTARLSQGGAALVLPKGEVPGLAMALGGFGVTLKDLTQLYAGLARGGEGLPLRERADAAPPQPMRLLDPAAAWQVGHVLLGTPAPENAAGGRIAYKTGTSYGYRDAWALGFDGRRTIGVWVGRPDGAAVPGLVGRLVAAPILFEAFARGGQNLAPLPPAPAGVLIASNARLPPPLQRYRPGALAGERPEPPLRILYPPNGARIDVSGAPGAGFEPVALKIAGGTEPLTVMVNGNPIGTRRGSRTVMVDPDGPGFLRLTVMDAAGAAESVVVRVQ